MSPLRKEYDQWALDALLRFDWARLGSRFERRDSGVWVLPLTSLEAAILTVSEQEWRLGHPMRNIGVPALPFPFRLIDFIAFCNATPAFAWDCLESVFTNDDGREDFHATDQLKRVSQPAYELVQGYLFGVAAPSELGEILGNQSVGEQQADAPTRPVQRQRAQEAAILAKLTELGIDPQSVPPAPPGKLSAAKQVVREALPFSPDVMDKAWQRLRDHKRIKDAKP